MYCQLISELVRNASTPTNMDSTEIQNQPPSGQKKFRFQNIVLALLAVVFFAVLIAVDADVIASDASKKQADSPLAGKKSLPPSAPPENSVASDEPHGYYHGIDISHFQGDFESDITPEDSITFVIAKATQGSNFVDPEFHYNWTTATQKGLIKGAYHFYMYGSDPVQQADFFWSTIGELGPQDIAPVIDLENGNLPEGATVSADDFSADVGQFLDRLTSHCSCTPIIYGDKYFLEQYLPDTSFSKHPLWIAQYTSASEPSLPSVWEEVGYMIWQKASPVTVDHTQLDFDVYYGPKSGLWKK